MAWYFIVPLGIALVVNYILKHSTDDIAYIATAILVVSLIVSLIIAPWQLQLFLVFLVLIGNLRIWQNNDETIDESLEKQPTVELSYRGINYKVQPKSDLAANEPVNNEEKIEEKTEEKIIGKYRGQLLKSHPQKKIPLRTEDKPNFEIKYRGIKVKSQKYSLTEAEETSQVENDGESIK